MKPFIPTESLQKQEALEDLKERIRHCQRCRLSFTRKNALVGEGDVDAPIMLVALSPGEKEDSENRMFIGPSGHILDKMFQHIRIDRGQVYMTNLIKCMLPENRKPKADEIAACKEFLDKEIAIIHSKVLVPLGYYATRTILTKYHGDIQASRELYAQLYGRLLFSDNQKIFPLPHPASLLYRPSWEPETAEKYKKLKTLWRDCKWFSSCPMKRFYEKGHVEKKWIELYCKGDWEQCVRYKMEEQCQYHPDWMLPDGSLDENLKALT